MNGSMTLKTQLENLNEWACKKVDSDCKKCNFSIDDGDAMTHHYYCPFDDVIAAAEEREKEVQICHT